MAPAGPGGGSDSCQKRVHQIFEDPASLYISFSTSHLPALSTLYIRSRLIIHLFLRFEKQTIFLDKHESRAVKDCFDEEWLLILLSVDELLSFFMISWSCMCWCPGGIALLKIYHLSLNSLTGPLSRACMLTRLHGKWWATPNSKSGMLCDTVVLNHTSKIWWMNLKNHLLFLHCISKHFIVRTNLGTITANLLYGICFWYFGLLCSLCYCLVVCREAIEFLVNEGFIYSTIDDDHYKSTTA